MGCVFGTYLIVFGILGSSQTWEWKEGDAIECLVSPNLAHLSSFPFPFPFPSNIMPSFFSNKLLLAPILTKIIRDVYLLYWLRQGNFLGFISPIAFFVEVCELKFPQVALRPY